MPPTVYRPPQKPATAATPNKNMGLLIGLGVSAALAVVGLILAGVMWSGKSAQQATVLQHQDSASALATTLGVTLQADTNKPIDWNAAWAAIDKAAGDQKTELSDAKTQLATLEARVTELEATAAELAELKTKSDQQATQLKQRSDELAALKATTSSKISSLEQDLEGAKQALADAQAAAEAAAAAAATAATDTATASTSAAATTPAGTEPTTEAGAASAEATPSATATNESTGEATAMETATEDNHFTFPEGHQVLSMANYDSQGQILKITLANQNELVYRGIPYETYQGLVGAPVPEVFFRMKIVGNYPCTPDDKEALRSLHYR